MIDLPPDHFTNLLTYHITKLNHEYTLINNRVTWLITSQTVFIGVYAYVFNGQMERDAPDTFSYVEVLIPLTGLILCLTIFASIFAAVLAIRFWKRGSNSTMSRVLGLQTEWGFWQTLRCPLFLAPFGFSF